MSDHHITDPTAAMAANKSRCARCGTRFDSHGDQCGRPPTWWTVPKVDHDDARAQLAATKAVLADRDRELLQLKGPCGNLPCRLHGSHSGPCDVRAEDRPGSRGAAMTDREVTTAPDQMPVKNADQPKSLGSALNDLRQANDFSGDFFEPDEPVENVIAAFNAGEKRLTTPPAGQTVHLVLDDPASWSPTIRAIEARGYRRAVDRLRSDDQGRGSALWTAFQWAADYLEGLETNQDASSTQPHEPQSADRVDIPAVPTVETPEAVRGAERVWAMPVIDSDVQAVWDGRPSPTKWHRYGLRRDWWVAPESGLDPRSGADLTNDRGPLTEVRDV